MLWLPLSRVVPVLDVNVLDDPKEGPPPAKLQMIDQGECAICVEARTQSDGVVKTECCKQNGPFHA